MGLRPMDLSPIAELQALRYLLIKDTPVDDLSFLPYLPELSHLTILETKLRDISPIAQLDSLEVLILTDTQVLDLSPLADMTSLKTFVFSDNPLGNPGKDFNSVQGIAKTDKSCPKNATSYPIRKFCNE